MMGPETPTTEAETMRCDERECQPCRKHGAENLVRCDDCGTHVWEWQAHYVETLTDDAGTAEHSDLCEACY